jgi:hypothetical protein
MIAVDPQSAPKPSRTLLAVSVLVIAACMFLVSMGIAGLTVTWDPCAMFGGLMIIPLPALLALKQYAGTFQRRHQAASLAGALAYVLSALPLFVAVTATGEFAMEGKLVPAELSLLPLAFAVPFLLAGYLNLRWSRQLQASGYQPIDDRFRMSVRELLITTAVIGAMLAMTMTFVRDQPQQFGINVTAEESGLRLPENASRVSYAHGFRGTIAYEFDTDEAGYLEWVEEIRSRDPDYAKEEVSPIAMASRIYTFNFLAPQLTGPDQIEINEGWYYSWNFEDQAIYAAFDRKSNRAYYFAHFH